MSRTLLCSSLKHGRNILGVSYSNLRNFKRQENAVAFGQRSIHRCACLDRFWESNPKGEYLEEQQFDKRFAKKERENLWGLKDGFKELRTEVMKWKNEIITDHFGDDSHLWIVQGDREPIWKLNNKEALSQFTALADSDHNEGFSRCELVMSPTGKGLFQGFVNTTAPKDGRVKYAGYCIMKSNTILKSFSRKTYFDWIGYTHLVMRVRGDGRSYVINLSTSGFYDITWNDVYHYVLFTRGGPYWQFVKIPFSKFVFGSKGRVQDMQNRIPLDRVSSVGIAATKVDGPFCLEVDYIGVECDLSYDEDFAYEMYRIPKFIAGV